LGISHTVRLKEYCCRGFSSRKAVLLESQMEQHHGKSAIE
jgi:hypothetical protein